MSDERLRERGVRKRDDEVLVVVALQEELPMVREEQHVSQTVVPKRIGAAAVAMSRFRSDRPNATAPSNPSGIPAPANIKLYKDENGRSESE